jgi:hypothetical protein
MRVGEASPCELQSVPKCSDDVTRTSQADIYPGRQILCAARARVYGLLD